MVANRAVELVGPLLERDGDGRLPARTHDLALLLLALAFDLYGVRLAGRTRVRQPDRHLPGRGAQPRLVELQGALRIGLELQARFGLNHGRAGACHGHRRERAQRSSSHETLLLAIGKNGRGSPYAAEAVMVRDAQPSRLHAADHRLERDQPASTGIALGPSTPPATGAAAVGDDELPLADRRPAAGRHTGGDRVRQPLAGHAEGGVLLD